MSVDNENTFSQIPDSTEGDHAPAPPAEESPRERKAKANRANARKSTGPRTEEGKQRVSQNARKPDLRLLGAVEVKVFNQDPAAFERLYRELIEPFEPAPALLRRHFQDLARLYLELEAWERTRDALIEYRAEQAALARRRLFHEMDRELSGTLKEVFEKGLHRLEDSPAKFKKTLECLKVLKRQLEERDFNLEAILHNLYGEKLDPENSRSQTICIRCDRLMHPEGTEPVSEKEFENLLEIVGLEYDEAQAAYTLQLDGMTMTRTACLARVAPTSREDARMSREGERLRQAIDRKQWVINGLLQTLGLAQRARPDESCEPDSEQDPSPGG